MSLTPLTVQIKGFHPAETRVLILSWGDTSNTPWLNFEQYPPVGCHRQNERRDPNFLPKFPKFRDPGASPGLAFSWVMNQKLCNTKIRQINYVRLLVLAAA